MLSLGTEGSKQGYICQDIQHTLCTHQVSRLTGLLGIRRNDGYAIVGSLQMLNHGMFTLIAELDVCDIILLGDKSVADDTPP